MNPATLSERIVVAETEIHETKNVLTAHVAELHETKVMLAAHIAATASLSSELAANTAATQRIEVAVEANRVVAEAAVGSVIKTNADMLDFFTSVKGAFKVFDMLGKLAKPLSYIAALVAALTGLWLTIKGHK